MKQKKISKIVVSLLSVSLLCSCGTHKDSAYVYQPQPYSQQRTSLQPKKQKREVDECIILANNEENGKYRAYGTSTSYQEEYALQNAEANAVTAMVQRMETGIEGARQLYNKNANANTKKISEGDIESIITQYIVGKCKNYRVVKTSLYDLSDGSIQCYVCIEMRDSKDDIINSTSNGLSRNGLLNIEKDKQEFLKNVRDQLESYKNEYPQE